MLIIDSGGVGRLAERSTRTLALPRAPRDDGLWPAIAPTVVLGARVALALQTGSSGSE
ncbi:MAG: hypothetical protein AAB131_13570 [Actinomycetota bacterium]